MALIDRQTAPRDSERRLRRFFVAILLVSHASLLIWGASRHSPTWDEPAQLASGIALWQAGRFDLYCVNPPMVRAMASIPAVMLCPEVDWDCYAKDECQRLEYAAGHRFLATNGWRSLWLLTLARWTCIPFSLIGAAICYRWAYELYGGWSGVLALALWCSSPTVLAYSQLITTDTASTALGAAACYSFWHWLKRPTWLDATIAGGVLGLAELTKFSWVILFAVLPLIWLAWLISRYPLALRSGLIQHFSQMCVILLVGVTVLNLGYGFEGSFQPLGKYWFWSAPLRGTSGPIGVTPAGNRFRNSWLGHIPVPVPRHYLIGLDVQKADMELKRFAYLEGEWKEGTGWWYYYLYALAIKEPLGAWMLALLAIISRFLFPLEKGIWRSELALLIPPIIFLVLASVQTSVNMQMRYVMPIFPFVFIAVGQIARALRHARGRIAALAAIALAWSMSSSLWIYPHSLSYFNELVGGPAEGAKHLASCNVDWGQDLLYLKRWLDQHPAIHPLPLGFDGGYDPRVAGIDCIAPSRIPRPGWHALSVNWLWSREGEYADFRQLEPKAMIGYSIRVYYIAPEDADHSPTSYGAQGPPRE